MATAQPIMVPAGEEPVVPRERFVARQPIFDARQRVFGYELLFRSGPENLYTETDGDRASARVVNHSLLVFGLDVLTGGKKAFINFSRGVLLAELYALLPQGSTVVELLETVEPDDEVIAACETRAERFDPRRLRRSPGSALNFAGVVEH